MQHKKYYVRYMARPLRIEYPGALYHITCRGNARQAIFHHDEDRKGFFEVLRTVGIKYNCIVHAYCLMDNHYHLLLETPDGNLSKGMRQLNGVYTQMFNRTHKRVGHLLQGRYKAILVEKNSYLLELSRYVVLNPVRAGIVKSPEKWKWSSYRMTAGYDRGMPFIMIEWILSQFGRKKGEAFRRYREFVSEGINRESPLKAVKGQVILGRNDFIDKISDFIRRKEEIKEIPKKQRTILKPHLHEIFEEKGRKSIHHAMYKAHLRYGYTLKDIAEYNGIHYSTVSRAIKKYVEDPISLKNKS